MAGKMSVQSSMRQTSQLLRKPQRRTFASTCLRPRGADGSSVLRSQLSKQMSKQKSLMSRQAAVKREQLPDDVGLLPEMLVKPLWKDLPSLFSTQWRRRFQIEKKFIAQKVRDFLSLIVITKWQVPRDPTTQRRIKRPMNLGGRHALAQEFHRSFYESVAAGNLATIEKIACTGLKRQVQLKIGQRNALEAPEQTWTVKYKGIDLPKKLPWYLHLLIPAAIKPTRILADRYAQFPYGEYSFIRQLVVRVRSEQTMNRNDGTAPITSDKDEIIVLQQLAVDGLDDGWKIWGTITPTSPKGIDELLTTTKQSTTPSLWDRMKDTMTSVGSRTNV